MWSFVSYTISLIAITAFRLVLGSMCSMSACRSATATCNANDVEQDNSVEGLCALMRAASRIRPGATQGKETEVTCDVYINSFDSVSVDTMDYQVDIYMRQRWTDPRLAYGHINPNLTRLSLDHRMYHSIWVPDLFFPNEKSSSVHCVTVPNSMIRIYPDGKILYSARSDHFNGSSRGALSGPTDSGPTMQGRIQEGVQRDGYTLDEIHLSWLNDTNATNPVHMNEDLELPQFDLEDISWGTCTDSYIIGSFACLEANFFLRRQYGYFMIQTYVPSILIVTLSWTSFWINMDAVPARISLGVLTVLTLTTQCVGVWMSLPRVSYIKAIDTWMAMCIIMVFSAMLEFATVNTLSRKEIRRITVRATAQAKDDRSATDNLKRMIEEYTYGKSKPLEGGKRMIARRVDKVSRWLFPFIFVIFNVIYWSYYLS